MGVGGPVKEKRLKGCSNSLKGGVDARLGRRSGEDGEQGVFFLDDALGVSRGGKDRNMSLKCFVSALSSRSGTCVRALVLIF